MIKSITTCLTLFVCMVANGQDLFLPSGNYGHSVGFTVEYATDFGRSFRNRSDFFGNQSEQIEYREVPIGLWFPIPDSLTISENRIRYIDYVQLQYDRYSDIFLSNNILRNDIRNTYASYMHPYIDSLELIMSETQAFWTSPKISGTYPLIIYVPSLNAPLFENFLLCELLASQGFVVAAFPAQGMYSSSMLQMSVQSLDVLMGDIQFIPNYLRKFPFINMNHVGTVGYSIGGLANVLLACRNRNFDAIISWDGSVGSGTGLEFMENYTFSSPKNLYTPIAQITKSNNPTNFIDSAKYADTYLLKFDSLSHGDFQSHALLLNHFLDTTNTYFKAHQFACLFACAFMNYYLNGDDNTPPLITDLLQPKRQNIPVVLFNHKRALPSPPSSEEFVALYDAYGIDTMELVFNTIAAQGDTILRPQDWRVLYNLAYRLLNNSAISDAIRVIHLNLHVFPDWYLTHYALGEACFLNGDSIQAISNFKKCLAYYPGYQPAREALQELGFEYKNSTYELSKKDLEAYCGRYRIDLGVQVIDQIKITCEENSLAFQFRPGNEIRLLEPVEKDVFILDSGGNNQSRMVFRRSEIGKIQGFYLIGLNSGRYYPIALKIE